MSNKSKKITLGNGDDFNEFVKKFYLHDQRTLKTRWRIALKQNRLLVLKRYHFMEVSIYIVKKEFLPNIQEKMKRLYRMGGTIRPHKDFLIGDTYIFGKDIGGKIELKKKDIKSKTKSDVPKVDRRGKSDDIPVPKILQKLQQGTKEAVEARQKRRKRVIQN